MEQQKVVISPPSTSFAVLNLLSLALMYSKIEKGVYLKWWVVLSPTTLFLVYSLGKVLYFLARAQRSKALAVFSSSKLVMIWKFTQIIIISSLIAMNIFISEYLQKRDDAESPEQVTDSLKHIFASAAVIFFSYLGYSSACKSLLIQENYLLISSDDKEEEKVSIKQMAINAVLSVMGNTMTICAGGSCNSVYMSTISAFFTAFGIPIVEYIHYLNFIAFVFVAISLISLYSVKNSIKYPPFIISAIGSVLILSDLLFSINDILTYLGNALMIGGAIWNSRLNKFSFASQRKKKKQQLLQA